MPKPITKNTLFYGDNLPILREHIANNTIDLIYLDPPFNSSRSYNVLFKDESGQEAESQITAFEDTWHWGEDAQATYYDLVQNASANVSSMISALHDFIGTNQIMAYLTMMTARLIELHRVLKPTGSIYLHCDPTASHYLKIVMDTIFGFEHFVNEIFWERSSTRSSISKSYRRAHDVILFYTKTDNYTFNMQYRELSDTSLANYRFEDENGRYRLVPLLVSGVRRGITGKPWNGIDPNTRGKQGMHWVTTHEKLDEYKAKGLVVFSKSGIPNLKYYLKESPGVPLNDNWYDIPLIPASSTESLGYPTQKPIALLERIIQVSSKEGDVVLDPFCGCGTAIAAAEKLDRLWIGIDITHLSTSLLKYRLKDSFEIVEKKDYDVIGEPETLGGARQLARDDKYQFQWWALSLVQAKPLGGEEGSREGKKGSDKGVDGVIPFVNEKDKTQRVLVQVKGGHVGSPQIRDLRGTVEREGAAIGVFITLEEPSQDMKTEAASSGYYHSLLWDRDYPRIQILTIEELLNGKEIDMPPVKSRKTFKQAKRITKSDASQDTLF
jgi:site-specific DNA-methyltransferase (adenine-specific)